MPGNNRQIFINGPTLPQSRRAGYTLAEMLVVIAIISIIVTMAVPAFNLIRGDRSVDAGQNQLNAIVGRARQDAAGLQDYRGVLLFQDPNTTRTCAVEVYFPDPSNPTVLGLVPNRDEVLLPLGISFRMIENQATYSPMNLVMFNSAGQFVSQAWTLPQSLSNASQGNPIPTAGSGGYTLATTQLVWRINNLPWNAANWPTGMPMPPTSGSSGPFSDNSAFGILLFTGEKEYQDAYTISATTDYLTRKGVAFMVNRYNGTLIRSE